MVRTYKPKPGTKSRRKHSKEDIEKALVAVNNGLSYRKAEERFHIPKAVLQRHKKNKNIGTPGRPVILGEDVENMLVKRIITCGEWGYPLDSLDLRLIVKGYLDKRGIQQKTFKNNMPGKEWMTSFLKRHKANVGLRVCQNIKRSRAQVSPEVLNKYFDNLTDTLEGVPPENILNFDETNLSDDPGRKTVLMKRGTKYPERVMNSSKSAVSLMYAGFADGKLLPPYVVYKAKHIYDTWTTGGPVGARYNRSKSGWFDLTTFSDWFEKTAFPKLRNLTGKKVLLGDNLSSHLSLDVIKLCEENDIQFCFLPPNSTHLTQPLDVAFFRPMKMAWRKILEKWKKTPAGRKQSSVPKDVFPSLLNELTASLNDNAGENIKAGFDKCGIFPLNRERVISRLPSQATSEVTAEGASQELDDSFRDLLKQMRYDANPTGRRRKKKIEVEPGKSVTGADLENENIPGPSNEDRPGTSTGSSYRQIRQEGQVTCRRKGRKRKLSESSEESEPEMDLGEESEESEEDTDLGNESEDNSLNEKTDRDSSDSDDEPLIVLKRRKTDLQVGDFILFQYDGDVYPGKITAVGENRCTIESMKRSGSNWKWPEKADILSYPKEDIIRKIKEPTYMNRGVMIVKELKENN